MGIKSKIQGSTRGFKERADYLKKDTGFLKEFLNTKKVVYIKTDEIAVLFKKRGEQKEYFQAFAEITKEGYELKSQEIVTDPIPKLNLPLGYIYYFQNKKFIQRIE